MSQSHTITVRAEDGLALSSRNGYLSAEQRAIAPVIQRTLKQLAEKLRGGSHDFAALLEEGRQQIEAAGLRMDYLEIREALSLRPASVEDKHLVILAAAFLGTTRLIDNLPLQLD